MSRLLPRAAPRFDLLMPRPSRVRVRCSRHPWLGALGLLSGLALWLIAADTRAQALPWLTLDWTAPDDCPDQAELVSLVEHALDSTSLPKSISVKAGVTKTRSEYRAVLRFRDRDSIGERALSHTRCDILADSVALVIALSAADSSARPEQRSRTLVALSVHAAAVSGPLPELALGGGGALAIEGIGSLHVELSASYFAQQTARYDQLAIGATFQMARFAARSCGIWGFGRLDIAPCVGAELFYIRGTGFGGMAQQRGDTYVWGPELSALVRVRAWGPLAFNLVAGVTLALSRQRFRYSDLATLHQAAPWAFQVGISPEVLF